MILYLEVLPPREPSLICMAKIICSHSLDDYIFHRFAIRKGCILVPHHRRLLPSRPPWRRPSRWCCWAVVYAVSAAGATHIIDAAGFAWSPASALPNAASSRLGLGSRFWPDIYSIYIIYCILARYSQGCPKFCIGQKARMLLQGTRVKTWQKLTG
jgi:hypothetical protein